jgi:hypothetical protein
VVFCWSCYGSVVVVSSSREVLKAVGLYRKLVNSDGQSLNWRRVGFIMSLGGSGFTKHLRGGRWWF